MQSGTAKLGKFASFLYLNSLAPWSLLNESSFCFFNLRLRQWPLSVALQIPAAAWAESGGSWRLGISSRFPHGWQCPTYLNHPMLFPRVLINRKLQSGTEPGSQRRYSAMGH